MKKFSDFQYNLKKLRDFMQKENLDAMLIPSTDEYLNEYNSLEQNSRYLITGFSGSTGDALVTEDNVFLFVDGRYHKQADDEVDKNVITVLKLGLSEPIKKAIPEKMQELLRKNAKIGLITSKISYADYKKFSENEFKFVEFNEDIITQCKSADFEVRIVPVEITGKSADEKLDLLVSEIKTDIFLITKLEEIAYLTNLRSTHIPYSSSFKAKAVIKNGKCYVFSNFKNDVFQYFCENFKFLSENEFENFINSIKNDMTISFSPTSINLKTYRLIERFNTAEVKENSIAQMKSIKTNEEIEHLKECFLKTDIVVNRAICWLNQGLEQGYKITEKDLSDKIKNFFYEQGAYNLSFEVILAGGKNSAIIHYTNADANKMIQPGEFILLDCGAYFEGGYSTDITRTFFASDNKIQPTNEQKFIYTKVLKALLNGLNHPITANTSGFDVDKTVRDIIDENFDKNEFLGGFKFAHGTGHGVGISVHDGIPHISPSEGAKIPLKSGMVFTIEPGLYNENWGGVRLENTVYLDNGKIKTLVKSNFDKKLINLEMLNDEEKIWLEKYQKSAIG
ncbi:MAG: M24 family metallopeptidase [Candidatus Gastranaerophilales bacterium]|nr:M24 family metallopeptidase [Candidatus Gastranaerophilales bacterium]